jgi:hypothetical protein
MRGPPEIDERRRSAVVGRGRERIVRFGEVRTRRGIVVDIEAGSR